MFTSSAGQQHTTLATSEAKWLIACPVFVAASLNLISQWNTHTMICLQLPLPKACFHFSNVYFGPFSTCRTLSIACRHIGVKEFPAPPREWRTSKGDNALTLRQRIIPRVMHCPKIIGCWIYSANFGRDLRYWSCLAERVGGRWGCQRGFAQ